MWQLRTEVCLTGAYFDPSSKCGKVRVSQDKIADIVAERMAGEAVRILERVSVPVLDGDDTL